MSEANDPSVNKVNGPTVKRSNSERKRTVQQYTMKYFLKNIAQSGLVRTIILVLVGLCLWIVSLWHGVSFAHMGVGVVLVLINSLLATQCAYRVGWTNLPSGFVFSTVWLVLSALSLWQLCWQVHLVAMMFFVAMLVFSKMNLQQEATKQAYTLTLLCLVVSPQLSVMITCILYILGYLLTRSHFTWRVLVAILLAIATYVMYSAIFRYLGWFDFLWLENLPKLPWQWWLLGGGIYLLSWLLLYLPLARPSTTSGVIYIIGIIGAITGGIFRLVYASII